MKRGLFILYLVLFNSVLFASLDRDLILAVAKGKLTEVQKLVEQGAKIDARYDKGKTALHWAAVNGDLKMAAFLISKGADVNARDDNKATPLHLCGIKKNLDLVKYLLYKGADIQAKDANGWTPLHYFVFYQNTTFVKYMLVQDADINAVTTKKFMEIPTNSTPLDIANIKDYTDIASVLSNPDVYRMYSKMPILSLNSTNFLGADNRLVAPEKGFIQLTVENKGGGWASNTTLKIEPLSNTSGLILGDFLSNLNIGAAANSIVTIPVEALKNTKNGTAIYRITAVESNYNRSSEPILITIPTLMPQPPQLNISALADLPRTNLIQGLDKGSLHVFITNSGIGYAEEGVLRLEVLTNFESLRYGPQQKFFLEPQSATNLTMPLEALETLKDGKAAFRLIAEDLAMKLSATNEYSLLLQHLFRPNLEMEKVVRVNVLNFTSTNIFTNTPPSNDVNVVSFQTNLTTSSITNFESIIRFFNRGETSAKNISIILKLIDSTLSNIVPASSYQFSLPELQTNMIGTLKLPVKLQNLNESASMTWNIEAFDERKLSSINTNLIFLYDPQALK